MSVVVLLVAGLCSASQLDQEQAKAEATGTSSVLDLDESTLVSRDQLQAYSAEAEEWGHETKEVPGKHRRKRSFGLLAALMARVMQSEAVEEEIEGEEEEFEDDEEDDALTVVRCSLVLDRRSCTVSEKKSKCTNYYERKCFLFRYPNLETIEANRWPLAGRTSIGRYFF